VVLLDKEPEERLLLREVAALRGKESSLELRGLRLESELLAGAQVFLGQVEVAGAASGSSRQVSRRESALEPASTARIVGRPTGAKTNPRDKDDLKWKRQRLDWPAVCPIY
jgi:hypothetical protein